MIHGGYELISPGFTRYVHGRCIFSDTWRLPRLRFFSDLRSEKIATNLFVVRAHDARKSGVQDDKRPTPSYAVLWPLPLAPWAARWVSFSARVKSHFRLAIKVADSNRSVKSGGPVRKKSVVVGVSTRAVSRLETLPHESFA